MNNRTQLRWSVLVLLCAAMTAGCAGVGRRGKPTVVPEIAPGIFEGYLPHTALPNSMAVLPPPPTKGSAAFALDQDIAKRSFALRGTPRWMLAISDADLHFPHAAGTFSCVLGAPITQEGTPHLYMLLRRSLTDAGLSTYAAKNHYQRSRPFRVNEEPMCTPDERAFLEKDGSYPSGHTAIGWAWALILAEVAPERIDAILTRGRAFGESRNVCNVHWHSDVMQGRFIGASTVARLHADPAFRAELDGAKVELAGARAKNLPPQRDCDVEASAMTQQPTLTQ